MKATRKMFDCPIEDDCILVFECDTCHDDYLIPRSECKMRMEFALVNERIEYKFVHECPKCHVRMDTTVLMR